MNNGSRVLVPGGEQGTLIYQTSPHRWLVELANGSRQAFLEGDLVLLSANVDDSAPGSNTTSEAELRALRQENAKLKEMLRDQKRVIDAYEQERAKLKEMIRNAKDPTPIERVSWARLQRLAQLACLSLKRVRSWILVTLGNLSRKFKNLREAWDFLSADDWKLDELFPAPGDKPNPKPCGAFKVRNQVPHTAPCKYCGIPIHWLPTDWGRWLPHEQSGSRHRCQQYRSSHQEIAIPFT